jgi:hypothetical protein
LNPVYYLTDDDFVHDGGDDPIKCKRIDPYSVNNWIYLEYKDRGNYYAATPIGAFDQNYINNYGLRMGSAIQAHEFNDVGVAQQAVQLILQRQLYIRNIFTFKLSFEYCLLDPMDIVAITDSGLGLAQAPVRILAIEEGDDGLLTIEAEEFPRGVGVATAYGLPSTKATTLNNRDIAPCPVNTPIIFEPPASLTNGTAQVWAAVSASVPPMLLLAETAVTSAHYAQWNGIAGASGESAQFSIQVQPGTRMACSIVAWDGSQCDFDLVNLVATPKAGNSFTGCSITENAVGGVSFYILTVALPLTGSFTPSFQLCLSASASSYPFALSYAGTSGNGIYIWQAEAAAGGEELSVILGPPMLAGAALTAQPSLTTPDGIQGGADANWGGCFVWASTDGVNYANVGTITAQARMGAVTSATSMGAVSGLDQTSTLVVDLIESGGALTAGTPANAQAGTTLCVVGPVGNFELIAYSGLKLLSGGGCTYQIGQAAFSGVNGEIARGLYGTAPVAHYADELFARLDSNVFIYELPSQYIGTALYFKFQSFNVFGNAVQDISECTAYSYSPTGEGVVGVVLQNLAAGANADLGQVLAAVSEDDTCGAVAGVSISYDISLGTI